jgi:hypothetical protein
MKLSEFPKSFMYASRLKLKKPVDLAARPNDQIPVIVSLTTIPSRLPTLHLTIRSVLLQEKQPEKIVLWLHEGLKNKLPKALDRLQNDVFEIRYSPYEFSHRKLIHSLQQFPDHILVTCDDDLMYPAATLGNLYQSYLSNPNVVMGHKCREITYVNGTALPYLQWPFVQTAQENLKLLMPVGAFMVLYPPGILDDRATDVDLFMKVSPRSDDLWFKTMSLLNGKTSAVSTMPVDDPLPIWGTQRVALKNTNNKLDHNRVQWEQIVNHFGTELTDQFTQDFYVAGKASHTA